MQYLEVANSTVLALLIGMTILVVVGQSVLFVRKGLKRGQELGLSQTKLKKVVANAAIFSVLPSLPIIVMLLALSIPLGRFFPWLRLSVVGSAAYEGMAANIAANSMGLSDLTDPGLTPQIFGIIMLVMTIGIIWGILFNILFMKHLDDFSKKAKAKKNNFIPIFTAAIFSGMLATLSAPYVANLQNIRAVLSFLTAGIAVLLLNKIAKETKVRIISEFSLPVAMIVGMAIAIIHSNFGA